MPLMPVNPTVFPTWIHAWEAFIKAHEKMFLILGGIAIAAYSVHVVDKGVHGYLNNKHVEAQTQINQQIATSEANNKALETQIAQMQANYQALAQSLSAAIAAQKQVFVAQQKKDDAMPTDQLAGRWQDLIKSAPNSVIPQSNGTLNVSSEAAHTTVDALEQIPELTFENQSLNKELSSCNDLSAQKDKDVQQQKDLVAEEKKGRAADAVVAKDAQRNSFWKGFKIGYIAGVVTAIAVKIFVTK
jgi:hypothetical protein